ncbi:hypothetical protein MJH12_18930, partial [bacterium]|nr:hypothetical protein [bacterium]
LVGKKWEAALSQNRAPILVVNCSEGEPGTFKDKYILKMYSELLLLGIHIAARTLNISEVIIAYDEEFGLGSHRLKEAMASKRFQNDSYKITLKPSSGTYLGGEETALLEHLEGKEAIPRMKPPFPFQKGLFGQPTLIHNAETLTWIPVILDTKKAGNFLVSLSGEIKRSGVFEVKAGDKISKIIQLGLDNKIPEKYQAFELGGASGVILPEEMADIELFSQEFKEKNLNFSSGSIRVISPSSCLINEVSNSIKFFERESCGKCAPCRLGTKKLHLLWSKLSKGIIGPKEYISLKETAHMISQASMCGLGKSAANQIFSLIRYSPEILENHINNPNCKVCNHE